MAATSGFNGLYDLPRTPHADAFGGQKGVIHPANRIYKADFGKGISLEEALNRMNRRREGKMPIIAGGGDDNRDILRLKKGIAPEDDDKPASVADAYRSHSPSAPETHMQYAQPSAEDDRALMERIRKSGAQTKAAAPAPAPASAQTPASQPPKDDDFDPFAPPTPPTPQERQTIHVTAREQPSHPQPLPPMFQGFQAPVPPYGYPPYGWPAPDGNNKYPAPPQPPQPAGPSALELQLASQLAKLASSVEKLDAEVNRRQDKTSLGNIPLGAVVKFEKPAMASPTEPAAPAAPPPPPAPTPKKRIPLEVSTDQMTFRMSVLRVLQGRMGIVVLMPSGGDTFTFVPRDGQDVTLSFGESSVPCKYTGISFELEELGALGLCFLRIPKERLAPPAQPAQPVQEANG